MSGTARPADRADEHLFVSTTPGLEPALADELREFCRRIVPTEGGADVVGPIGLHQILNVCLRTASRVLLRLGQFEARDNAAMASGLSRVCVGSFLGAGLPVELSISSRGSRFSHGGRIRELAADAWKLPLADESEGGSAARLHIRIVRDVCTVSVDTSGELLHRRGYREEISRAPLRETLAAGLLRLAGYRGDEPLWDPMCGSGTILIEAAQTAVRQAPGLQRSFAFQRWPSFDASKFEALVGQLRAKERTAPSCSIRGSDNNAGALGTARRNARRAAVLSHLVLERADVLRSPPIPSEPTGIVVTNPPYGIRAGEPAELPGLYSALGALLRERLPRWRAAILVPDVRLERTLELEIDDAFEVLNGGIRCRLLVTAPHAAR